MNARFLVVLLVQGPGGGQEETQYFIVGENGKLTAAEAPLLTSQQVGFFVVVVFRRVACTRGDSDSPIKTAK